MIIATADVSSNTATASRRWQAGVPSASRRRVVAGKCEHLTEVKCFQWREKFRNNPYFFNWKKVGDLSFGDKAVASGRFHASSAIRDRRPFQYHGACHKPCKYKTGSFCQSSKEHSLPPVLGQLHWEWRPDQEPVPACPFSWCVWFCLWLSVVLIIRR